MSSKIPNYLFRLRRNRGYSQKQLAHLVGLRSPKAISDLEHGYRLPPLRIALLLEIALGTRVSEMYPGLLLELSEQAIAREALLPARFSRHIRGRVLRKE